MEEVAPPSPPDLSGTTILQIIPDLETGGAERTAVDVAAALVRAGARALVVSRGGRLVPEAEAAGAECIPFDAATKNPLRIVFNADRLRHLALANRTSLIHARSRAPAWSGLIAARRAGLPFVTTYHGAYNRGGALKNVYNSVMARGDVVIANSHFTARLIAERHPFAKPRVRVVHRGTDFSAFDAAAIDPERIRALRASWGIADGRRVVLLAARLTGWKGQEVLVDAVARLAAAGREDFDVVLAGDAQGRETYRQGLIERILTSGLGHRIRVVGHCADMPAAFALADVVTVPSTEPEAFGRAAVEAQALGRPVVVSDLGAVPETVLAPPETAEADRTGWRVPPGDPRALAMAITQMLDLSPESRAALAVRARRHVEAKFSRQAMTDATLRIYAELLGRVGE
jgi:glycosyltransferase involved in cell wall biosynthesis